MSRLEGRWRRLASPFSRKWAFTAWWPAFAVLGIVLVVLGTRPGTVAAVLLYAVTGILGAAAERWRRKARLYEDTARLLAEQLARLEQGD